MNTSTTTPITFEQFDAIYRARLGDDDQPSCYLAYVRAESQVEAQYGERRYKNYQTFVATRTRLSRRENGQKNVVTNSAKVPINCQLCDTELYTVPRGDLRTIIPHFCEGCREEIRKLIFV